MDAFPDACLLMSALVALAVAIIALTQVRQLRADLTSLNRRFATLAALTDDLHRRLHALAGPRAEAGAAPAAPTPGAPVPPPAAPVAPTPPRAPALPRSAAPPAPAMPVPTHAASVLRAHAAARHPAVLAPSPAPVAPARPAGDPPPPARPPAAPAPRRRLSLEEFLSLRVFVAIAAVLLALGGIFLVKYTFESGLLSPSLRVLLGAGFGLTLLAVGQWRHKINAGIAQAVSAAGIATLFACVLAAVHIEQISLPPTSGFVLMALITAGAVALALQQGPFIAALGLLGGFLTPVLVNSGHPNVGGLFGYLFLLQLGLLALSRARGWSVLAGLTLLG
jgi:uncharacterized membrane protein